MFRTHPKLQTVRSVQDVNKHIIKYVRTVVRFRVRESRNSWLHVNMHTVHPATAQMNPSLPPFSAILQKLLSSCPNSRLYCTLLIAYISPINSKLPKTHHNAAFTIQISEFRSTQVTAQFYTAYSYVSISL